MPCDVKFGHCLSFHSFYGLILSMTIPVSFSYFFSLYFCKVFEGSGVMFCCYWLVSCTYIFGFPFKTVHLHNVRKMRTICSQFEMGCVFVFLPSFYTWCVYVCLRSGDKQRLRDKEGMWKTSSACSDS
ncbi:hypothetical protein BDZ91DRAFT_311971 [Kalaharituber pfeilii]|nr:hypothetical protein BDZ91DRAFT_311971 [Kalaharituber pfeilii]